MWVSSIVVILCVRLKCCVVAHRQLIIALHLTLYWVGCLTSSPRHTVLWCTAFSLPSTLDPHWISSSTAWWSCRNPGVWFINKPWSSNKLCCLGRTREWRGRCTLQRAGKGLGNHKWSSGEQSRWKIWKECFTARECQYRKPQQPGSVWFEFLSPSSNSYVT